MGSEAVQITAYQQFIASVVNDFTKACTEFGEPLNTMGQLVKRAFDTQLNFIKSALHIPRPSDSELMYMIQPLTGVIGEVQEHRNRHRHVEDFFNHLSTVSESIMALNWVGVAPTPVPFVRDMKDAGDYFGNRVLSTNKGNVKHTQWIQKWNSVLKSLEQYVKTYHLTGFSWGTAQSAGAGVPAPPPPPPPELFKSAPDSILPPENDSRNALLNELNQGVDIVRMLKPVHSGGNRALSAAQVSSSSSRSAPVRTYPPKLLLEGRKWRVEHQKDNYSLVIEPNEMSESLAMFRCENSGLEVKNKMNSVTIDNCKRTTVVLSDIISAVEIIRSERIKIQCCGHIPIMSIDNCDSVEIYVTEKSRDVEMIFSKSTSCNVCLLAPDGDYQELSVPEQIKTVVVDRKLRSTVVEKI